MSSGEPLGDDELIAALSIPPGSRVPDAETGSSSPDEYDLYFRISRDEPGLLAWSRSCLRLHGELVADLDRTSLSTEDKLQLVLGLLSVHRATLQRWVAGAERVAGEDRS